jgi:titin
VVVLSAGNQVGGGTRLTGNVISGSYGDGVLLGAGDTVVGNLIGTDSTGSAALLNRSHGIDAQSTGVTIRGNVISANGDTGVVLFGGSTVRGNFIGTDVTGRTALGNGLHPSAFLLGQPINGTDGIVTCGGANLVGGTAPGDGNVVDASGGDGISLVSDDNVVQGNRIGTDSAGVVALGNKVDGIGSRSDVFKGTGFCQQAPNNGGSRNHVGGTTAGSGNLISGNGVDGVDLVASDSSVIAGNHIGTNASATAVLGNAGHGVELGPACDGGSCVGSSNNVVGGTSSRAGNVIAGNGGDGVHIDGGGGGLSNAIQGNSIGTSSAGTVAMGNHGAGVFVGDGAVNDSVGGSSGGAGNDIAFNVGAGVLIGLSSADSGTHSAVQANIVHSNGGLGIDIAPVGAVNCTTAPPGPNDNTACPVIVAATTGAVSGRACAGCSVEVFLAAHAPDDQGHGEAAAVLGATLAAQDGSWTLAISPGRLSSGNRVTATATTPPSFQKAAETSEFAANVAVA